MSNFKKEHRKDINIYFTDMLISCCPGTKQCQDIQCCHKEPHIYNYECETGTDRQGRCWRCVPWIENE